MIQMYGVPVSSPLLITLQRHWIFPLSKEGSLPSSIHGPKGGGWVTQGPVTASGGIMLT